jgi:transcription antitermination factor NusG
MPPEPWFALTVKPKHEKTASRGLQSHGLEEFLPVYREKRRWSDRVKELDSVLFPGYVFCRVPYARRLDALNAPGVRGIVSIGRSPAVVEESEIAALRAALASGRPIRPWPFLSAGQPVVIERGPLAGLRGTVLRERDAWRVIVSVDALQRSVSVEIDRDAVAPTLNP